MTIKTPRSPSEIARMYDDETGDYIAFGMRMFNAFMLDEDEKKHVEKIHALMAPAPGSVIYDMGCGIGEAAKLMRELDGTLRFVCVTNSVVQCALIPKLDGVTQLLCDYHRVDAQSGSADVVMFNESIGYGDLPRLMEEAFRLLRPGGVLFIKDAATRSGESELFSGWDYVFHGVQEVIAQAKRVGFQLDFEEHDAPASLERFRAFLLHNGKSADISFERAMPAVWRFVKGNAPAWDSPEWRQLRDEKLLRWLNGNHDAVSCVVRLGAISEVWDDLIDRDAIVSTETINEAFVSALVELNANPFYKANEAILYSQIVTGINGWMDANRLQHSKDEHRRMLGFFVRNLAYEIFSIAAFCVGGWEHLRAVSLEMREFFSHESYEEWEHRHVA